MPDSTPSTSRHSPSRVRNSAEGARDLARIEKTVGVRGEPDPQLAMLSSLSTEDLIPSDHPIRRIRVVVDAVLAELDDVFDGMYAAGGRRSVPPEVLLKATVLMALYSVRSERAFCERLNYDLLFMAEGVGRRQGGSP